MNVGTPVMDATTSSFRTRENSGRQTGRQLDSGSEDEGQGHASACLEATPGPFLRRCGRTRGRQCSHHPGVTPRRRGPPAAPRARRVDRRRRPSASVEQMPGANQQLSLGTGGRLRLPLAHTADAGARGAAGLSSPRESGRRGVRVETTRNTCSSAARGKPREAAKERGADIENREAFPS